MTILIIVQLCSVLKGGFKVLYQSLHRPPACRCENLNSWKIVMHSFTFVGIKTDNTLWVFDCSAEGFSAVGMSDLPFSLFGNMNVLHLSYLTLDALGHAGCDATAYWASELSTKDVLFPCLRSPAMECLIGWVVLALERCDTFKSISNISESYQ